MTAYRSLLTPKWFAVVGTGFLIAAPAFAQVPPSPAVPPTQQQAPAELKAPPQKPTDLSSTQGVIRPPASATNDAIAKPTPSTGAFPTPVIPPPGTPGGNPNVVPK
jgi:hypothetical protein